MIIAEIGLNHQGDTLYSLDYCKKLVNTNVDAVTYQIREREFYEKDEYKKLELTLEHYQEVGEYLHRHDKLFGVALANHDLVDDMEKIGVDFYKVLSWDVNSFDFITKLVAILSLSTPSPTTRSRPQPWPMESQPTRSYPSCLSSARVCVAVGKTVLFRVTRICTEDTRTSERCERDIGSFVG